MITGLHYQGANRLPDGLTEAMRESRLSRLAKISQEYRRTISEMKDVQREMSRQVATSLVEDILSELKSIAKPIFNSLTKLDVEYLAFRMQQMAILSEAMVAINQIKKHVDRVVVSKEIGRVFDELKVAILEVGYDFHHPAQAEQLNAKIEGVKSQKLKEYAETMEQYREELLRKKTALEDLSKQIRMLEKETGMSLRDLLSKGKYALFCGGNVSMPLTEVIAMIAYRREYGGEGVGA